ncbi:MAG: hypothetical protein R2792_19115 [Saprospiraceae bacterium]
MKNLQCGSISWLEQHLALIGAFKPSIAGIDAEVLLRSSIFADNPEGCILESNFAIPIQEGLFAADGISLPA